MSSGKDFCLICAVGVPQESKIHSSFHTESSTYKVLSELLKIQTTCGGVIEEEDGADKTTKGIMFLCAVCTAVVQDLTLTGLKELLKNTQNAIRKKIEWIRNTFRGAKDDEEAEGTENSNEAGQVDDLDEF